MVLRLVLVSLVVTLENKLRDGIVGMTIALQIELSMSVSKDIYFLHNTQ